MTRASSALLTASSASRTATFLRSIKEPIMSTLRKVLYVSLPLAAAGALWFGHQTQPASAADRRAIVRPAVLVAPGRVETVRDPVALAFATGGRIISIDVDEGQAVQAGP